MINRGDSVSSGMLINVSMPVVCKRLSSIIAREVKREMTIEYLKCRADLNFEVDFGVNGAIGAIVTKWDLILFG